jgi:hypothetical protein
MSGPVAERPTPEHGEEAAAPPSREEWEERRPIVGCDRSTMGPKRAPPPMFPGPSPLENYAGRWRGLPKGVRSAPTPQMIETSNIFARVP